MCCVCYLRKVLNLFWGKYSEQINGKGDTILQKIPKKKATPLKLLYIYPIIGNKK
jgi:hypothetical protein